eukprot:g41264.t1
MNSSWGRPANETFSEAIAVMSPAPDPFSGPLHTIEPWNFKVLATLMFFVTFLSLSENFLVLLVTYRYKQLQQPLNYIILNLSVADLLGSAVGGTLSFVTNLYGYFFLGAWACVLEGFAHKFHGTARELDNRICSVLLFRMMLEIPCMRGALMVVYLLVNQDAEIQILFSPAVSNNSRQQ